MLFSHLKNRDLIAHFTILQSVTVEVAKYTPPSDNKSKTPKPSSGAYGSASSDRPYACPYEGCEKAYIHEYKLKLHLRDRHRGHISDENAENAAANADNEMDEASDQEAYGGKRANGKNQKQSRPKPNLKLPTPKVAQRKGSTPSSIPVTITKKSWPVKEEAYEEEDSEETEEDRDNVEDGWRYGENNEDDDEETEFED